MPNLHSLTLMVPDVERHVQAFAAGMDPPSGKVLLSITVQNLLDKGAVVDAEIYPIKEGTALQAASFRGHDQIIRLLLEKGADANVENHMGSTPLAYAAYNGSTNVINFLIGTLFLLFSSLPLFYICSLPSYKVFRKRSKIAR